LSRGPGALQVRTLAAMALYDRCRAGLWQWQHDWLDPDAAQIERLNSGEIIPLWVLRRDLECPAPALTKALRGLYRRDLVSLYGRDLEGIGRMSWPNAKYASVTGPGRHWLAKRQLSHMR